ncbi:presenilin family intramembrane aspartyl protease [Candidatus Marsarchaeota archaeon]|nr:presenilin family intramembrane aspartyl protease [Candidatus Marsarchaeota archaeon]
MRFEHTVVSLSLKVIEYRQLLYIIAMFMFVQFFGLLLGIALFNGEVLPIPSQQSQSFFSTPLDLLFYVAYIIIVSLILILLFKVYKGKKLFIAFEAVVIFIASMIVFMVIFGLINDSTILTVYGTPITTNFSIAAIAALVLIYLKNRKPQLRNVAAIIASVGVGLILGISFPFYIALLFMGLIAIYDFVAVFITKHMLALARVAEDNNLALLIGVNEVEALPARSLDREYVEEYRKNRSKLKKGKELGNMLGNNLVPIAARVELGTGDLAIPLMVAISAYSPGPNFVLSFFVIFGAIAGLLLTMFILRKYKRALPAIPPLFFGIIVFVLLYILVRGFI